jgi:hypothetical protein
MINEHPNADPAFYVFFPFYYFIFKYFIQHCVICHKNKCGSSSGTTILPVGIHKNGQARGEVFRPPKRTMSTSNYKIFKLIYILFVNIGILDAYSDPPFEC